MHNRELQEHLQCLDEDLGSAFAQITDYDLLSREGYDDNGELGLLERGENKRRLPIRDERKIQARENISMHFENVRGTLRWIEQNSGSVFHYSLKLIVENTIHSIEKALGEESCLSKSIKPIGAMMASVKHVAEKMQNETILEISEDMRKKAQESQEDNHDLLIGYKQRHEFGISEKMHSDATVSDLARLKAQITDTAQSRDEIRRQLMGKALLTTRRKKSHILDSYAIFGVHDEIIVMEIGACRNSADNVLGMLVRIIDRSQKKRSNPKRILLEVAADNRQMQQYALQVGFLAKSIVYNNTQDESYAFQYTKS